MAVSTSLPFSTVAARGVVGRCPKCGQGDLFRAYLKPVDACTVCGEKYGHIRADDGPAWLTILVVGHIAVPSTVALAMHTALSDGMLMAVCSGLIIVLTLCVLPRAKGMMIAAIWRSRCNGV